MATVNARQLHLETSSVLDELEKGKSFDIERNGCTIGTLQPAPSVARPGWKDIMGEVWAAQKRAGGKSRNPVLAERERRRR